MSKYKVISTINGFFYCVARGNICSSMPIMNRCYKLFAVEMNPFISCFIIRIISLVREVHNSCCYPAIIRKIPFIIINPVDLKAMLPSVNNAPFVKRIKRCRPFFTNFDPGSPVVLVTRDVFIAASIFHVLPNSIKLVVSKPMRLVGGRKFA